MLRGSGATRLFQISGITVFLHWSWLLVAVFEISGRTEAYSSLTWNVLEYVSLFGIVTLHEFGHAFACRSVGGQADEILLWPLGGIAIVDPPPRPGAVLWSIAAGPLVNVALLPIFGGMALLVPGDVSPNLHAFLRSMTFINAGMLVFNLLPIYPLDGGQILGALLWFVLGRPRSMMVTAIIGLIGVVGLGWLALMSSSLWLGLIALFVALQCRHSIQLARSLRGMAKGEGRTGIACPACHSPAPVGRYWPCRSCGVPFDVFDPAAGAAAQPGGMTTLQLSVGSVETAADVAGLKCPVCQADAETARCLHCHAVSPVARWNETTIISSSPPGISGMTRFRLPRAPSVYPIVLGVCAAIAALMGLFVAIFTNTLSSREADAGAALFMRQAALVVSALSLVPAVASILFFVRYQRRQKAFHLELQRFQDERDRGKYSLSEAGG